ncbi:protein, SNF2 family [Opisthorchis viverrini]|uniref:Protein, SNF2 family n=1 Tax=Opisthorchis viverrini TaxID=6198 RepID=A0A1S8X1A8_OPIVI|nr:protein, SNF2 family [Opisthorchis viverrini]
MLLQEAIDSACAIDVNAADITSEDLHQFGIRNVTLRDYQLSGVSWLASCSLQNRGAILCDEMGLGKTCQVIAFLSAYFRRKPHSSILLVCPLSVMDNWINELNRFFPSIGFLIYSGDQTVREEKRSAFKAKPCPILLTTYELCINDQLFLETVSWDILVVDEGHRLKNSDSLLYKVLSEACRKLRFILTGTPVQNNLTELYSLLHFVSPSHFPKSLHADFVNYFGTPDPTEQAVRDVQMGKLLRPFLLRRTKQQVLLDLPPRLDLLIYHSLTPLQTKIYRALLTRNADVLTSVVSTEIGAPRAKVPTYRVTNLLMQLRKCVDHPYLFDGVEPEPFELGDHLILASSKLVLLDLLLDYLYNPFEQHQTSTRHVGPVHKVLIFSQMTRMLDIVQDYLTLKGYSYERLDGSVRGEDRVSAVNCFNRSNETFLFLLSTKAGGQGLNLVAADTVIFIDSDFNPQNDIQAAARAHRIGQTKPVRVIRLVGRDTVEEAILSRADVKLKLTARVLGSGEMAVKGDEADIPSPEELAMVLKFGLARLLDNMNLKEVEDASSLSDKPDLNFAEILGETHPDTWHWLPPLPVEAKLNSNKQSNWVLLTETPYQCKVSEADLQAVAQLKEEQEAAAVAEGYRIRSQGPVPPTSLSFEKRPKVGQKQLTPEELAEKKKKAEEAAELRLQKAAEAAAKRAERKLEKKKALWKSAGYLSMSVFRELVSEGQENPETGTVLDAILVEDEANLNEEPGTAVTIHYVFGDASEPLTNFEENCSSYRKPAIVCFSVDDSGGWARGGFFAALQKQSTKPRELYELAGEMDDLNMGDCHLIPVLDRSANTNIHSTANMTFSDVLLLRDRETLQFPFPVNFCGLLIAQQHSRRSQTSGSPPDLHIDSLERSLTALGMACRALGHCSVHLPRIGQGTHAFQWYTVERLLRKHLVERSHTDVYADATATATPDSSETSAKRSADDLLSDERKSTEPARKQAHLSRHLKNLFTGKVFYLWLDDHSAEESTALAQHCPPNMIRFFITLIWGFYEWYLRPAIKFALRRATGKCELHRLILAYPRGAMRTFAIEQSMRRSKCDLLRGALPWTIHFDYNSRASELARIKNVDISSLSMYAFSEARLTKSALGSHQTNTCLRAACDRNKCTEIYSLRPRQQRTPASPHTGLTSLVTATHSSLVQLWNDLAPVEQNADPASRRWSLIGFQTDNPYTDFRGMGILSLKNMVYFSSHHTKLARSLLSASNHPQHWYPFAILAINVTEMLYVFLEKGQLKNQFYNTADQCSLDDFYKLFCKFSTMAALKLKTSFTFHSFHEYWMKTVRDVMFFNFHREQFRSRLESRLQSSDCRLGLTGSNGDVSFFEP